MFVTPFVAMRLILASPETDPDSLVLDRIVRESFSRASAEFVVNAAKERAWVETTVDNGSLGEDHDEETFRARVAALSYDASAREIVYRGHGGRVVCARVTDSRFLLHQTRIKPTGRCRLTTSFEHRNDDDGFERVRNKHLVVTLHIGEEVEP